MGEIFGPEDQPPSVTAEGQTPVETPNGLPQVAAPQPPKPFCGNGKLEGSEGCDDGNLQNGDGCTAGCKLENGFCGDGKTQTGLGEQCDAGKAKNGAKGIDCTKSCLFPPTPQCGDGIMDPGMERCDAGNRNADVMGAPCRSNCMLPACGDGIRDTKEECDDRNLLNGDGCSSLCKKEVAVPAPIIANVRPAAEITPSRIPTPARTPTGPGLAIFLASGAAAGIGLARKRMKRR